MLLGLFKHTEDGSRALAEVLRAGVESERIAVVGDLGIPAGEAGAMHHVTLDRLGIPAELRSLVMDDIRSGGVVLAVAGDADWLTEVFERHGALRVERPPDDGAAVSHNVA